MSGVLDALTEEECYLAAILQDRSGLDIAEFCWESHENDDNCFRAWPYQWNWWRCDDPLQIDMCARSVGKSLGIKVRMFAHPFVNPGQEAVITAPELVHLEPIIQLIEQQIENTRLGREMMRKAPTHRPFMSEFLNGARLIGRIPQRDGKGVKGCVEEAALIFTRRGLVEAINVVEGDYVWSHEGRWAEVVGVDTFEDEGYELRGQGSMPLVVNDRHSIYGRWNRSGPKGAKDLGPPGWASVGALIDSDQAFHWVAPVDFPADQAVVIPAPLPTNGNSRKDLDLENPSFWWLVGRWLADGYCGLQKTKSGSGRGRVFWVVHPNDQPDVVQHFDSLGWVCSVKTRPHSSADILEFSSTSLVHWLHENFGKLANGKRLHPGVLFLREELRRSLLDGYISGDGTHTPSDRARWTVSSASRELIGGIGMLAHSLGFAVGFWSVVPKVTHICGVALKKSPQTSYRANISWRSGTAAWDKEGLVAYKVKSVTPVGRRRFVNIVSNDHSYVANGILHHNTHPLLLEHDEACFVAGTLILTQRGLAPIENVLIGDSVMTHKNRWQPVVNIHKYERPTVAVSGQGCPRLEVTANHRFWVKDLAERDWRKRGGPRRFGDAQWMPISDAVGAFWSSPAEFPASPVPDCPAFSSRERAHDVSSEAFAWILGLYLAEGSVCSSYGRGGRLTKVYFSIHSKEVDEVRERLRSAGMNSHVDYFSNSAGANVYVSSQSLARWMAEQVPSGARNKSLPTWVLGQSAGYRAAVLEGLVYGDGCSTTDTRYAKGRMRLSTTSHALAVSARLLGASLQWNTSLYFSPAPTRQRSIRGRSFHSGDRYEVVFAPRGWAHWDNNKVWTKVKSIAPAQDLSPVYDLEVAEDHSFVANGIVVHNSDYPEAGWKELIETLKRGHEGAIWRAHGVTRGLRDSFYRNSQHGQDDPPLRYVSHKNDNKWTVHRIVAQARPNWTDEERQEKIQQYGSSEDPDYRRNVIGAHGDSQSPIFVLHRLMRCVDDDPSTEYNTDEYWHFKIKDSELERSGHDILDVLDPPSIHQKYKTIWMGADIGFTIDPTEIMIAAECPLTAEEKADAKKRGKATPDASSRLKVIGRVTLQRIGEPQQADVIVALVDHYRPQVFAMDSTGVGLPLFQNVQKRMQDAADTLKSERAQRAAQAIKGYNFSSKILVEFDETVEVEEDADLEERIKESGIKRDILQHSTDVLRSYVDDGRLWLPWDPELIDEFRGQTYSFSKTKMDGYGRKRIFSNGSFHALDAMRMLALGHGLYSLEQLLSTKPPATEPVLDYFLDSNPFF